MSRALLCFVALLFVASAASGETPAARPAKPESQEKHMSGMSVVGNDDAPKALVIVPWKSAPLGDLLDVSRILDDGRQPVDREVLRRELDYYEIRAGSGAGNGAAAR